VREVELGERRVAQQPVCQREHAAVADAAARGCRLACREAIFGGELKVMREVEPAQRGVCSERTSERRAAVESCLAG
jgi:hypothetical protein